MIQNRVFLADVICMGKRISNNNCVINSKLRGLVQHFGLTFALLIALPTFLFSQSTYTSVQTGSWRTTSTWSPTGLPNSSDTVIIQDGHTVSLASGGGESIRSITIEAGGVLDMQSRDFDC